MVFNSTIFLFFFLLFYFVYWFLNDRFSIRSRNLFLLTAGYFFYGWWDWRFLGLIFISSLNDYLLGIKIDEATSPRSRKIFLACSIAVSLGILCFFKYFNFFLGSLIQISATLGIEIHIHVFQIILPVGLSFYTFQSLSYTIDIYRKKIQATRNAIDFFTFVSFFPQLVAGPIERAANLLKQFSVRKTYDYNSQVAGLRLVLYGLFKKVVIADNLGMIANKIFDPATSHNGLTVLLGGFIFAVQIYCDFSGYSDIAIGLARMLDFRLMKNFDTPYFSASFTEFWRRWHISLSTWFRDYVYIPLGGNKGSKLRTNLNILITFLLSGFWHGARLTFILWGALHGMMLLIEKNFSLTTSRFIKVPFVFILTCLFWIPFRAVGSSHLKKLAISIFQPGYSAKEIFNLAISVHPEYKLLVLSVITLIFIFIESKINRRDFSEWIYDQPKSIRISVYYFLSISVLLLGNVTTKPFFIYFQF